MGLFHGHDFISFLQPVHKKAMMRLNLQMGKLRHGRATPSGLCSEQAAELRFLQV